MEDNGTVTKTEYCGPFVYETVSGTRSLKYIVTPEGRAVKSGSSWDYEYNLTDHLGNVRAVIRKGSDGLAELIQQQHYYPFGMEMSTLSSGASTNKYLYNGKEYQDDFDLGWFDYGARFYDPELGRFHTVDPKATNYYFQSPYAYGANNPIRYIDVNGEFPWGILVRAIWDGMKKPEGKPVITGSSEIKMTTGKFKLEALGVGGGYSKGGGEQALNFSFELHNNGHVKLGLTHINRYFESEVSYGPVGGKEAKFKETRTEINSDDGFIQSTEMKTEDAFIYGPAEINDEKVNVTIDGEVTTPIVGVGASIGVDVNRENIKDVKLLDRRQEKQKEEELNR